MTLYYSSQPSAVVEHAELFLIGQNNIAFVVASSSVAFVV